MRHNTLTLIFGLLFLTHFLTAQNSSWRILGGIKNSFNWEGTQSYTEAGEDFHFKIEKTQPAFIVTSYSLIYNYAIGSKWGLSIGLNYNKKGFEANGTLYDIGRTVSYKENKTRTYGGFLIGGEYNFYQKNSWKLNAELLLNPEFEMSGYTNMKKFAISSIALLNIEKHISNNFSIVLNPFFETALMQYKQLPSTTFRYTPYGYGLMVGLKYSIIP